MIGIPWSARPARFRAEGGTWIIGKLSRVLILLPPSEGKTAPARGKPVDLAKLVFPELAQARAALLERHLLKAPAAPADRVYSGVLYQALDVATLPPAAHSYVRKHVLIFSSLWGVVRPGDRIPFYKGPGSGTYWRPHLPERLGPGLIVDLRSGPYAAMWRGKRVTIRVLHEHNGQRKIVSHFNKATKGRLVRDLACASARPRSLDELVDILTDLKYAIEREEDRVDVIVTEL